MNARDAALHGRFLVARQDGRLLIEHADPRIVISAKLLDDIRDGHYPEAKLRCNVLTIDTGEQRVIYRIGGKVTGALAYVAEWPD
jgi:hypothetical protein